MNLILPIAIAPTVPGIVRVTENFLVEQFLQVYSMIFWWTFINMLEMNCHKPNKTHNCARVEDTGRFFYARKGVASMAFFKAFLHNVGFQGSKNCFWSLFGPWQVMLPHLRPNTCNMKCQWLLKAKMRTFWSFEKALFERGDTIWAILR